MCRKPPHAAREHVDTMIASGAPFERIEHYIEQRRELSPESKSALWLLAWAETDRDERREAVDELLSIYA